MTAVESISCFAAFGQKIVEDLFVSFVFTLLYSDSVADSA